jgi:hypothetical protein
MPTQRTELRALALAKRYFADHGWHVEDVSRSRGHNGYDLLIARDGHEEKVEVKGCSRAWQIPDLFSTEFDANRVLVADVLCVVYLVKRHRPRICLIPRAAILPEFVISKQGYRLSSQLKKESALAGFVDTKWPGNRWKEIQQTIASASV